MTNGAFLTGLLAVLLFLVAPMLCILFGVYTGIVTVTSGVGLLCASRLLHIRD